MTLNWMDVFMLTLGAWIVYNILAGHYDKEDDDDG